MPYHLRAVVSVVCVGFLASSWGAMPARSADVDPGDAQHATRLITASHLPGGMCIITDAKDATLPVSIGQDRRFVVQALYQRASTLTPARDAIQNAGLYGRVSADLYDGSHLPYVNNLINLVIVDRWSDADNATRPREILRVLASLSTAYIRPDSTAAAAALRRRLNALGVADVREVDDWIGFTKPWPKTIDQWTHYLHGADGNPVANDRLVGPPAHFQWLGEPKWAQSHESDTSLRCLVTAHGRIYYIVNEAPTSLAGPQSPPDKWALVGRDAFNGVVLWKIPVAQWGWRQWKPSWFTPRPGVIPLNLDKRIVAVGDNVYFTLGYRAPVSEIDGLTGKVLRTFDDTARAAELLAVDGSLIVSVLQDNAAVIKRIDLRSGKTVWTTPQAYAGTTTDYYRFWAMRGRVPAAKVDPTLGIATDGHVVAALDGDSVVGVDFANGKQRWRTRFPLAAADANAGRINAKNKVWNGAVIVRDGVVIHASPNQLAAFAAADGKLLWQQPKKFLQHLWYEWQDVFVIDGLVWTWSAELKKERLQGTRGSSSWPASLNGYDLHSGKLTRKVELGKVFKTHHHHRCYRNKATVRFVIASRRGSEFIDLQGGPHSINNWVRGNCHMGMMPANGLQYAPPHPCQCYIDEKLSGFNVLAADSADSNNPVEGAQPRLERGPVFGAPTLAASAPRHDDWPTFRADAGRSGCSQGDLKSGLRTLWRQPIGSKLSAPIAVGDTVYTSLVDEHQVVALHAADGQQQWRFTTGARVDTPPTYYHGTLLFGSADGCVYCVRAADGKLVWRLDATANNRRIAAYGQLEAARPVHGSILVHDDVAYFAAGRSSEVDGGLQLVAADPRTGRVLRQRTFAGPHYMSDQVAQNYQLPMGMLSDVLRVEEDALFMRTAKFDFNLVRQRGVPKLVAADGLLDGAYFKRMPWSMGKSGFARVIVYDGSVAYGLRMFDSLQGLDPKVYFTPGKKGYLLFAADVRNGNRHWTERIPIRGRALAVAENAVCVAGPPDMVDPKDPLGAFEGRKGGVLRIVDKHTGKTIEEHQLPSPPVFHGIAIARGRLYLTLEDGSCVCFGTP